MTRPIKPATVRQEVYLVMAIKLIQAAIIRAQQADAPRAVAAMRRALKSAEGAQRHMRHRRSRTEESTP